MEDDNAKRRKALRRHYNETVRELATFVRKRDKRVLLHMVCRPSPVFPSPSPPPPPSCPPEAYMWPCFLSACILDISPACVGVLASVLKGSGLQSVSPTPNTTTM